MFQVYCSNKFLTNNTGNIIKHTSQFVSSYNFPMLFFALEKCLEMLNYVLCYCCLVKLDKYIVLSCLNVITNTLFVLLQNRIM